MKCKKCGSESFETRIVDIINDKVNTPVIDVILAITWVIAIFSGIYVASILFGGSEESSKTLLEAITGTLTEAVDILILWQVFSGSVLIIIVGSLYKKLVPYKVIPVKKSVCKSCGAEQDDNK